MALSPGSIAVSSGTVLILIPLVVLPIAAIAFARSGPAWKSIGKGRFAIEQELPPSRASGPAAPVDKAVQAMEVRQMLEAKNYRRQRHGEPAIDVEAEMGRVLEQAAKAPPAFDEELRTEVRQLVVARNERRLRRGEPPLDVEAEVERQLADSVGS